MEKSVFVGITIGVIAVTMITLSTVSNLDFIVMGADPALCKIIPGGYGSSTRRCCWNDLDENGNEVRICETCTDPGDGSYINCKRTTTAAPFTPLPGPGCSQFGCAPTPGPAAQDQPSTQGGPVPGGIFQGDIIPTPGPAAQDQPSTQGEQDQPVPGGTECVRFGAFNICPPIAPQDQPGTTQPQEEELQGDVVPTPAPAAQDTPSMTQGGPVPGGIFQEDLAATEETVPATEETQPATTGEEPVPQDCSVGQVIDEETGLCVPIECPDGQILDEESGLCVLEEPQGDEQYEEEPQGDEQYEEENQESQNNGSEGGGE